MIYILTGQKQSGKTTRSFEWIKKNYQKKLSGVLSPVEKDIRSFYMVSNGEKIPFSVVDNKYGQNEVVFIGKYIFYKRSFELAIEEIEKGIDSNSDYIIIDEIGPLELQKKGFYDIVVKCIDASGKNKKPDFIFIIREPLLEEIIDFFMINKCAYRIIKDLTDII